MRKEAFWSEVLFKELRSFSCLLSSSWKVTQKSLMINNGFRRENSNISFGCSTSEIIKEKSKISTKKIEIWVQCASSTDLKWMMLTFKPFSAWMLEHNDAGQQQRIKSSDDASEYSRGATRLNLLENSSNRGLIFFIKTILSGYFMIQSH